MPSDVSLKHAVGRELWPDCLGPGGSRLKHGPNFNKVINTGDSAPRQLPPPPLLALPLTRTPALSCSLSALLPRLPSTLTPVGPPLLPTISRAPPSGPRNPSFPMLSGAVEGKKRETRYCHFAGSTTSGYLTAALLDVVVVGDCFMRCVNCQ